MTSTTSRDEAFREQADRISERHRQFKAMVLDEVCTSPVPLTASDVHTLMNRQHGWNLAETTYREALRELEAAGSLISRKETSAEALVRGGGTMPKARRPHLYADAEQATVPTRLHLPAGIKPSKSLDIMLLEELSRRYVNGASSSRPRTIGRLAEHLGATKQDVKRTLHALEKRGKVYQNASSWFIAGRERPGARKSEPVAVAEITSSGTTVTVQGATEAQTAPPPPFFAELSDQNTDRIEQLMREIGVRMGELASMAGAVDSNAETVQVLRHRVGDLEAENADLRAKLQRFRDMLSD